MDLAPHEHLLPGCLSVCALGVAALVIAGLALFFTAERTAAPQTRPIGTLGDPRRGERLLSTYGCPACHAIPHAAPRGLVGPPLSRIAARVYIAGCIPNEPIDMMLWIEHPQRMKPGTAMPDLGVSRGDAYDMASYLATLK
jgi:cytochrome c